MKKILKVLLGILIAFLCYAVICVIGFNFHGSSLLNNYYDAQSKSFTNIGHIGVWSIYDNELHGYYGETSSISNEILDEKYTSAYKYGTVRITYPGVSSRFQEALIILNPFNWSKSRVSDVDWYMAKDRSITVEEVTYE
jgi:hypothetical protein